MLVGRDKGTCLGMLVVSTEAVGSLCIIRSHLDTEAVGRLGIRCRAKGTCLGMLVVSTEVVGSFCIIRSHLDAAAVGSL